MSLFINQVHNFGILHNSIVVLCIIIPYFHAGRVTIPLILAFFTGAEQIPPLGFPYDPVLTFADNPYPTASTCAIQLTLPTKYSQYSPFKSALDLAFTSHGGFGLS